MASAGIIGMGSWGSALAYALGSHGHHVTMWSKFEMKSKCFKKSMSISQSFPASYFLKRYLRQYL